MRFGTGVVRALAMRRLSFAARPHARLLAATATASTVRWCSRAAPEVISLDDIEVEGIGWDDASEAPSSSATHACDASASSHGRDGHSHVIVDGIDSFSKSKVLNYLKRAMRERGLPFQSASAFEVEPHHVEAPDGTGDVAVFRCRVRLVVPAPHSPKIGEGIASNPKDAETLAAMHAERVLDALGVPLYALGSMQAKHAESARKNGRWAPLPGDAVRPIDTLLPPPLMLSGTAGYDTQSNGAVGSQDTKSASASPNDAGPNDDGDAATQDCGNYDASGAAAAASLLFADHYGHTAAAAAHWARMSATEAASAGMYDASEGNTFQPCAIQSTRCSNTADGVTLPLIYDKDAKKRVAAFMRFNGRDLDRSLRCNSVAVKGTAYRMFVAELAVTPEITATGKAIDRNTAIDLAAMHAELLLDFHGVVLFPDDAERQARHAALARGCGRWAPASADDASNAPSRDPKLAPLPIKQVIVGSSSDSDGLGIGGFARAGGWRCYTERIMAVHNELSLQWNNTFVEVHPPPAVTAEARAALRAWMASVGCRFPDLYVCTRMGDFARATIVLPLPAEYGVRGGNSVGRTTEQAMDLAALNAVDVLCAFGIPLYSDPAKQAEFAARRVAMGLVMNAPFKPDGAAPEAEALPNGLMPSPRSVAPPGYHVEGQPRDMPRHADVLAALQLPFSSYNVVPGSNEQIIERGNAQKPQVQAYIRRLLGGTDRLPVAIQTGTSPAVRNVVYLRVPLPERFGPGAETMAVGYGLKKKDADRVCFMHAYALLEANGVEMRNQKELEVAEARARRKSAKAAKSGKANQQPAAPPADAESSAAATSGSSGDGPAENQQVTFVAPLMHPALQTLQQREDEAAAAKRARPRFDDRL